MSRATTITTHKLLKKYLVCVPQSQVDAYSATIPRENILPHPDAVVGLSPKLNWILREFAGEEAIMIVDDDVMAFTRCFIPMGDPIPLDVTDPEQVHGIFDRTYLLAKDVGAKLFGFMPNQTGVRYYTGLNPFNLTGFVLGCGQGFIKGHGLKNDERLIAKMDYDISALNAYKHRIIFRNDRYCFRFAATFSSDGGQAHFRTSETEDRDVKLLIQKWGNAEHGGILKLGGGKNSVRRRDYAGVSKVTLHLPF